MTHSSPSDSARVRIEATSEPASGSVTPMQPTISPRMLGARNCCFNSSRAEVRQRGRTHVGMHGDAHRDAGGVGLAQLLAEDERVPEVQSLSAVLLGIGQAEHAEVAHLLEEVVRGEDARLLPLLDVRVDLFLDEAPHHLAEHLMLLRELHGMAPLLTCDGAAFHGVCDVTIMLPHRSRGAIGSQLQDACTAESRLAGNRCASLH